MILPKGTNLSSWYKLDAEAAGSLRILEENGNQRVQVFPKIWILRSIHSW